MSITNVPDFQEDQIFQPVTPNKQHEFSKLVVVSAIIILINNNNHRRRMDVVRKYGQ